MVDYTPYQSCLEKGLKMIEEQTRAAQIVLDYLEENNSHTIGKLLHWDLFGATTDEEKISKAWELARDYIYYGK